MDDERGARLTFNQVIDSTLITVGYSETVDRDLDYAAEVVNRGVQRMRDYEKTVNFTDISAKEKMKAVLVLHTMYALEEKMQKQQQQQQAAAASVVGNPKK